jgi:hypothetical protein
MPKPKGGNASADELADLLVAAGEEDDVPPQDKDDEPQDEPTDKGGELDDGGKDVELKSDEELDEIARNRKGEVYKDPKKHQPEEGSKRFNEIYGELQHTKRELEEIRKKGLAEDPMYQELKALASSTMSTNKDLTRQLTELRKTMVDATSGPTERTRVEDQLARLKEVKREAREKGDIAALDDANDQIRDLERVLDKAPDARPSEAIDREYVAKVLKDFKSKAKWYDEDPLLRAIADAEDNRLLSDPVWAHKPLDERLDHLLEVMEETHIPRLKGKNGGKPPAEEDEEQKPRGPVAPKMRAASVEGGTRRPAGGPGAPKTVRLSPTQMSIADGLGVSYEEYADELSRMEKRRGR